MLNHSISAPQLRSDRMRRADNTPSSAPPSADLPDG
jgi:hypothetical protein